MSTPLLYSTSTNAVQKTLDAALLAGVTAAATLNNVVGIQNKAGVFVVDRVDANGTATPSKREYIVFTGVSGSTLTTLTRNADGGGTDQDHAVGAIVEFVSDVLQEQAILDALLLLVTTAGALDTTKVVDLTTAQTLTNKTLTSPKINENVALTATATELNLLHGQLGAWTTWSSTTANITVGSGSVTARYIQIGKTVHFFFSFSMAANSSMGTAPTFTLPVTMAAASPRAFEINIFDSGLGYIKGIGVNEGSSTVITCFFVDVSVTAAKNGTITSTAPMTWTTSDAFTVTGTYEAA